MSYLAAGINQGFRSGTIAAQRRKDRKERERLQGERQAFESSMRDQQHTRDVELMNTRLRADAEMMESRNALSRDRLAMDAKRLDAQQNDPRAVFEREIASRELAKLDQPPSPQQLLEQDVERLKLEKERDSLTAPAAPPTAQVTQTFGPDDRSKVEYTIPAADAQRHASISGYQSPYADEIHELGRTISDHQGEIAAGDTRTGFLGIGSSRQDLLTKAVRKRASLQALELEDMVRRRVISQEEADRRADQIMEALNGTQ